MTLLSLYEKSDLIFIGRLDKKEDSGTNRVGDGFTVVTTKTYFDVETVLKGDARKFLVLDDDEFRYQIPPKHFGEAPRDAVFVEDIGSYDAGAQPKPGDTVLVFATGQGDAFELTDQRDGVKKLSPQDAGVYESRINEINSIFAAGKTDPARLADWLIRCAAEPVTRWDGAHDLLQGFRRLEWQRQANLKTPDGFDPLVTSDLGREAAQNLTTEQKTQLAQILTGLEPATATGKSGLFSGDRELVSLVKLWDSSSVTRCLAAQLRSKAYSVHENAGFMYMIAELLGNAKAATLARQYAELSATSEPAADAVENGQSELRKRAVSSFLGLLDKLLVAEGPKKPC